MMMEDRSINIVGGDSIARRRRLVDESDEVEVARVRLTIGGRV
jgi:hypothetical protein